MGCRVLISSAKGDIIIQKYRLLNFPETRTCEVSHRAMMNCNSSDCIHKKHNSLMDLIIRNNKPAWNKRTAGPVWFLYVFFFLSFVPYKFAMVDRGPYNAAARAGPISTFI